LQRAGNFKNRFSEPQEIKAPRCWALKTGLARIVVVKGVGEWDEVKGRSTAD
jgi:hypothetical protein